ncbi:MAG: hypothetical protein HYZ34_01650, partial [Ignavibacteriae bacterium]|nr:hypothetical protein [Ignavibacteriota bacterium]
GAEITRTLPSYNTALSFIWLAQSNFNIMIEAAENFISEIDDKGDVASSRETIISPGIRYAIDIGELQVVPGIAFPFSFSQTSNRNGMFLYLSFEHPF